MKSNTDARIKAHWTADSKRLKMLTESSIMHLKMLPKRRR